MDGSRFRRLITTRVAGGAILLFVLMLLAGCAVPLPWVPAYSSSSSNIVSYPPPRPYVWKQVTPPPATPQAAFIAGVSQIQLCNGRAGRALTQTWLVAGPTYGMVVLRADCSNVPDDPRDGIAVLPITLDKRAAPACQAWILGNGGIVTRQLPADANPGQISQQQVPSWLPLPKDTYLPEQVGGGMEPSSLFVLESSTRLFVTGRYEGRVTRPAGAETISVGGRSGWQTSENAMVTVTVPLADGWTFYFAGTADAATMQRLASAALPHLDTLLPKPIHPQPAPAC